MADANMSTISFSLKMAFAAADSVTGLKLIEAGLPKEKIALMALPMVPLQIILPWIIRFELLQLWRVAVIRVAL